MVVYLKPRDAKRERIVALEAEVARLRGQLEDACRVFEHYDLPEHAFHYRRELERRAH